MAAASASPTIDLPGVASELRVVLGQLIRRLRAEHRFSLAHGAVLGRLDREGARSTSDLAASERVRPQSMAQTISDLEAEGLITRRPDPADARRSLLEVTDKGRDALVADRRQREGWLAQTISETFTEEEQETLARAVPLLTRLASS
jgi:DNA-binding MarR family transcriptional regulator